MEAAEVFHLEQLDRPFKQLLKLPRCCDRVAWREVVFLAGPGLCFFEQFEQVAWCAWNWLAKRHELSIAIGLVHPEKAAGRSDADPVAFPQHLTGCGQQLGSGSRRACFDDVVVTQEDS